MKKRDAKLLAKKSLILEKYFKDNAKPDRISKDLRVLIDLVYRTVEHVKKEMKDLTSQV
jgi:ribosomal protein S15P/S13E